MPSVLLCGRLAVVNLLSPWVSEKAKGKSQKLHLTEVFSGTKLAWSNLVPESDLKQMRFSHDGITKGKKTNKQKYYT